MRFTQNASYRTLHLVIVSIILLTLSTACGRNDQGNADIATATSETNSVVSIPAQELTTQPYPIPESTQASDDYPPPVVTEVVTPITFGGLQVPLVLGIVLDEKKSIIYIEPDSGAETGGLQIGDVIQAVNGQSIESDRQLIRELVSFSEPGKTVALTLIRAGELLQLEITPRPYPTRINNTTPTPILPPNDYL